MHNAVLGIQKRPSILFPVEGNKEGLTSGVELEISVRADRQKNHPPLAAGRLYDVRMSGHRNLSCKRKMPVCHDRISRTDFIIAIHTLRSCHHHAVIGEGAALCNHQIIIAVDKIQVRRLDPFAGRPRTVPDHLSLADKLEGDRIQLAQINPVMSLILRMLLNVIAGIPHPPVLIEKDRGVDAVRALYKNRVTPGACRILRRQNIVVAIYLASLRHKGVDQIEGALMIPDGRCPQTKTCLTVLIIQLLRAVNAMSDLLPVNQIFAVKNRNSRIIVERGGCHIVILPDPADGRIRIKSGKNRVVEGFTLICDLHELPFCCRRKIAADFSAFLLSCLMKKI